MDIKETIIRLSEAFGTSGREDGAAQTALELLREFVPDAEFTNGNVIGTLKGGKTSILLDAHIDQVGFVVTSVTDDGFIRFNELGGIDRRLLPAQPVLVHGSKIIPAVICSMPPHLSDGDEVLTFDKAAIDTGYSKEELEQIVSPGDAITFEVRCR